MRHRSVRFLVLILIALFAVTPPTAEAGPWHGEIIYYYDASHSIYVGRFVRFCNNYEFRDGVESQYYTIQDFNCDEPEI